MAVELEDKVALVTGGARGIGFAPVTFPSWCIILWKRIDTIPSEVIQALKRCQWPGNVRELENFIERAVILSPGPVLRAPLSELVETEEPETQPSGLSTLENAEREHILRALREAKGLIAGSNGAAARLGLKRTTLNAKMRKLGITRKDL